MGVELDMKYVFLILLWLRNPQPPYMLTTRAHPAIHPITTHDLLIELEFTTREYSSTRCSSRQSQSWTITSPPSSRLFSSTFFPRRYIHRHSFCIRPVHASRRFRGRPVRRRQIQRRQHEADTRTMNLKYERKEIRMNSHKKTVLSHQTSTEETWDRRVPEVLVSAFLSVLLLLCCYGRAHRQNELSEYWLVALNRHCCWPHRDLVDGIECLIDGVRTVRLAVKRRLTRLTCTIF